MRAPAFWWQTGPTLAALALAPIGFAWGALSARRMKQPGTPTGVPVICIGNFVAGGAGKTPAAMACAQILIKRGLKPAFLTRGYGGAFSRSGTTHRVDPNKHTASQAGDEPLLLARIAATFVAADRLAAAQSAQAMGSDILIMDDGLQNPAVEKTLSLAVVDGETGVGNGHCIPAGPLRAPLADQIDKVDAVIVLGNGVPGDAIAGRFIAQGKPAFRASLKPEPAAARQLAGRKVIAFAGIGRPEKFFGTLEDIGADIAETFAFGDHQVLEAAEIKTLTDAARTHQALLVTTEKDFVRVGEAFQPHPLAALPVTLVFEDEKGFAGFVDESLTRKFERPPPNR